MLHFLVKWCSKQRIASMFLILISAAILQLFLRQRTKSWKCISRKPLKMRRIAVTDERYGANLRNHGRRDCVWKVIVTKILWCMMCDLWCVYSVMNRDNRNLIYEANPKRSILLWKSTRNLNEGYWRSRISSGKSRIIDRGNRDVAIGPTKCRADTRWSAPPRRRDKCRYRADEKIFSGVTSIMIWDKKWPM